MKRLTFTVEEVAEALGCSRDSVYRRIKRGELPTLPRPGRKSQVLIPVAALEDYVARAAAGAA